MIRLGAASSRFFIFLSYVFLSELFLFLSSLEEANHGC
jgi:hypothetical protein